MALRAANHSISYHSMFFTAGPPFRIRVSGTGVVDFTHFDFKTLTFSSDRLLILAPPVIRTAI